MPKPFPLFRLLCFLAAFTCICATLALAARVAPAKGEKGRSAVGVIVLDIASGEGGAGRSQPPVAFDHTLHTRGDKAGDSCDSCHDAWAKDAPFTFAATGGKNEADLEDAFHDACISCHEARAARGMASGPGKAECRSCHNPSTLPARDGARADGGLDASQHARHVASDRITVEGKAENCAACHHPAGELSSPSLNADSCRSCHEIPRGSEKRGGQPAFADVAHDTCISCHRTLAPSGATGPVTCAGCHDASVKAAYPKLSPAPRLPAGQPDTVIMNRPPVAKQAQPDPAPPPLRGMVPDGALGAPETPGSAMPPVVFDHKRHEGVAANCVTCHHNTLRNCSSCHTQGGSPKGGDVTRHAAMHAPSSDRSCVGCHETRKLAAPECAGCHSIMPKAGPVRTNCASCHKPLPAEGAVLPAMTPVMDRPAVRPPDRMQAQPAAHPPARETRTTEKPGATALDKAIANAPDTVSIGVLSNEYKPAVFPHRTIVEKLAEGIRKTSPGMMAFHSEPYALCASCHHNSPPSATPPSCASCHAKGAGTTDRLPVSDKPLLKAAYHRQCMTCHDSMGITRPAHTDCASCHAKRAPGR